MEGVVKDEEEKDPKEQENAKTKKKTEDEVSDEETTSPKRIGSVPEENDGNEISSPKVAQSVAQDADGETASLKVSESFAQAANEKTASPKVSESVPQAVYEKTASPKVSESIPQAAYEETASPKVSKSVPQAAYEETASPKVSESVPQAAYEKTASPKVSESVPQAAYEKTASPKVSESVPQAVYEEPISPKEVPNTPSVVKSKSRSLTSELKSSFPGPKSSQPKTSLPERSSEPKTSPKTSTHSREVKSVLSKISESNPVDEPEKVAVNKSSGGKANWLPARTPTSNAIDGSNMHRQRPSASPGGIPCTVGLLQKRSPFIHDPPQPEERRARIQCPRTPKEYIINLREDLADFQESHGLPRTRDYSFLSLGLALAQETGRAIYSVFLMITELFPILAIVSLILRFALDKLIEIMETTETTPKIKKSIIFALEMLAIMIPLWILIGTIIIPLVTLILSIFKRMLRIRGGKYKVILTG